MRYLHMNCKSYLSAYLLQLIIHWQNGFNAFIVNLLNLNLVLVRLQCQHRHYINTFINTYPTSLYKETRLKSSEEIFYPRRHLNICVVVHQNNFNFSSEKF